MTAGSVSARVPCSPTTSQRTSYPYRPLRNTSTVVSTPSAVRSSSTCGSLSAGSTAPDCRPACQLTSVIGESSSQGTQSNSWIAEPVMLDSLVAPGADETPRLTPCTSTAGPTRP